MTAADNDNIICDLLSSEKTRRKAFEMIVRSYSERIYWKIRRIVIDHEDANDVMQNTFMKAWQNIDNFKNKSKLSTWLYSIAINESLDFVRKKKKVSDLTSDDISVARLLLADEYFDGDETQALLIEAIETLPDVQRTVFNMRYFENMKYSDMSIALSTTEGALKASYHIAVKKISDYFHLHE